MSDLVTVECPNCGAKLKVRDSDDPKKRVRCPKCEEAFVVPSQEEDDPPPRARKRRVPEAEDDPDESPSPRAGKRRAPEPDDEADEVESRPRKKRRGPPRDEEDDDRRPGNKKKKKAQGSGQLMILGIAVGAAFLLLGGVVLLFVVMPRGKKMTAPETFITYDAPEGEFACQVPSDWILQESGIKNSRSITVKKGKASILVRQSLAGSLIGDIAGAGNQDPNAPDERLPFSRVHEFKKDGIAEEIGGKYTEEAPTTVMTKGFGKARRSAFTSVGTFSRTRGYRATVLANMISYDIICQCSADDWNLLEPAFAKVITSLGHGTGR